MLKKVLFGSAVALVPFYQSYAAEYKIDTDGQHAFVQFKINHLGYSYIVGSFEEFSGTFKYDPEDTASSEVSMEVDISSLTTNNADRDKHIKSEDFLHMSEYPMASFTTLDFEPTDEGEGVITGELTLHGETQEIEMPVRLVGEGEDPWGSYRAGFEGSVDLTLSDYGIDMSEFPDVMNKLELYVTFEGVKQ
ncbi:YceI family protein [Halomonas salina]|uniref:YceI family protein n=1 Tax=Halomonas salina TaxID=42565 RepID=UPI0009DD0DA6|nr:YceI family protein [Halomonas salina]